MSIRILTARGRNWCRDCRPEAACALHPLDLEIDLVEFDRDPGGFCDACGGNDGTLAPVLANGRAATIMLDSPCREKIKHFDPMGGGLKG